MIAPRVTRSSLRDHAFTARTLGRRGRRAGIAATCAAALTATLFSAVTPASASAIYSDRAMAMAVFSRLNNIRRGNHLPVIRMDNRLNYSAYYHNLAMKGRNTMSHQLPGERSLGPRITVQGYSWRYAAENIGWSSTMTAASAVFLENAMYYESPPNDGHRVNILNRAYTDAGVNVVVDTAHHKIWLTVDFGRH